MEELFEAVRAEATYGVNVEFWVSEYNDLCLPRLLVRSREPSTEIATSAKQSSPYHWKFSKAHTGSRFAHGFQTSIHI
jgi:hypothetical protein